MGVVSSCLSHDDSEEADPLLTGQHNSYSVGANAADNEDVRIQQEIQERELKEQARNDKLRKVVDNLNDKLIDISMVSNSGIVGEGADAKPNASYELDDDDDDDANGGGVVETTQKKVSSKTIRNFIQLDSKKLLPTEIRSQLQQLHKSILEELDHELGGEKAEGLIINL